jgi:hypothetical protein
MSALETNRRKAGRRSSRTAASQPSLFRERELPRQESPRLREDVKAKRLQALYGRSDLRYE